jgi:hypothetical protein
MRMKRSLCVAATSIVSVFMLASCYKVNVSAKPDVGNGASKSQTSHFFIFGLVGNSRVDVTDFCGSAQAASVETGMTFVDGLLSALTVNIYTPRTVTVSCTSGASAGNSVIISGDSSGHPVKVVAQVDGRQVAGEISETNNDGVVKVTLAAQEPNR